MWIDSHCHLNHSGIEEKGAPVDIIKAAQNNGVDGMLTICCKMSEEQAELETIAAQDNVWCSLGTHPHSAGEAAEKAISQAALVQAVKGNDNVIAIGETGLDYYYDFSPRDDQQNSFRKHIRACIESDVPMVVHTRDAEDDTSRIMHEEGDGTALTGVMHCFSSAAWLAEDALKMGFYISFSGMITFKKLEDLRDIARRVPLDRVLVETDAPFLAPMPYRGKVNEPAFVAHTGAFMAKEIYGLEPDEFAKITTDNFFRLFKKAKRV